MSLMLLLLVFGTELALYYVKMKLPHASGVE